MLRSFVASADSLHRIGLESDQKRWYVLMGSDLVPVDSERFEIMEKVANLRMQGISDTAVAKQLNLKRKVVVELWEDYREALSKDSESRDRARDALHVMVEHYDRLIKRYYDLLADLQNEIFNHQVAGQINSALKQIGELEAKRLDAWQKAGLLDGTEMGNQMAEMEEKQQILISILRNDLCPECRLAVVEKLQKVTQVVEAVVVYPDDDDIDG